MFVHTRSTSASSSNRLTTLSTASARSSVIPAPSAASFVSSATASGSIAIYDSSEDWMTKPCGAELIAALIVPRDVGGVMTYGVGHIQCRKKSMCLA